MIRGVERNSNNSVQDFFRSCVSCSDHVLAWVIHINPLELSTFNLVLRSLIPVNYSTIRYGVLSHAGLVVALILLSKRPIRSLESNSKM